MRSHVLCAMALAALLVGCSSSDETDNAGGTGNAAAGTGRGGPGAGAGGYGAGRGAAPGSAEDLVQNVGDRIFFGTDQSTLNDDARTTLDRQSAWLQRYPSVRILISGNCDERGTEEYNLALGNRRAHSDADYLAAHGVNASRIQTISYGKNRPVDPDSSPEAWAKNRNAITMVQ